MDIDFLSKLMGIISTIILLISIFFMKAPHELLTLIKRKDRFFIFLIYILYSTAMTIINIYINHTDWYIAIIWYIIYMIPFSIILYRAKNISINKLISYLLYPVIIVIILQILILLGNGELHRIRLNDSIGFIIFTILGAPFLTMLMFLFFNIKKEI